MAPTKCALRLPRVWALLPFPYPRSSNCTSSHIHMFDLFAPSLAKHSSSVRTCLRATPLAKGTDEGVRKKLMGKSNIVPSSKRSCSRRGLNGIPARLPKVAGLYHRDRINYLHCKYYHQGFRNTRLIGRLTLPRRVYPGNQPSMIYL